MILPLLKQHCIYENTEAGEKDHYTEIMICLHYVFKDIIEAALYHGH